MTVTGVVPILLVRDVAATARFFEERMGFGADFLYGEPPFYGSVSRDGVRLHFRFVAEPVFAIAAAREESLIAASFEVSDVRVLFEEMAERSAPFAQGLESHEGGGTDFHVRDPDGNVVSFVEYGG